MNSRGAFLKIHPIFVVKQFCQVKNSEMMKKTFIILTLLLTVITTRAQMFKLGFQASPHITWMKSSDTNINNQESRLGIKYGLDADIYLAGLPRYCLNTGLFVANHSFKARYSPASPFYLGEAIFSNPVEIRYNFNYIEIPLNIKLRSDQFFRMTYYGQFGLTSQIKISATAVSSDGQINGESLSKDISIFNLCMLVGGGAEYDVGGNTALNFGIQYSNGLVDITTIESFDEKTWFNAIRIVIGVMF
jgi:hypothetical protein